MNIYLLKDPGFDPKHPYLDTFDAAVVIAASSEAARKTIVAVNMTGCWPKPEDLSCELIGTANLGAVPGVVLASFNAG